MIIRLWTWHVRKPPRPCTRWAVDWLQAASNHAKASVGGPTWHLGPLLRLIRQHCIHFPHLDGIESHSSNDQEIYDHANGQYGNRSFVPTGVFFNHACLARWVREEVKKPNECRRDGRLDRFKPLAVGYFRSLVVFAPFNVSFHNLMRLSFAHCSCHANATTSRNRGLERISPWPHTPLQALSTSHF